MKRLSNDALKLGFLAWQCRIRQMAMRDLAGQPQPAMQPSVSTRTGRMLAPRMTVLLIPEDPANSTAYLRFQIQRTSEPERALDAGLKYLAGDYYQLPELFCDEMTAVFAPGSPTAAAILAARTVLLDFEQFSQRFRMFAGVRRLKTGEPGREASLAHNRIFNPNLPNESDVLGFKPQWKSAAADPWP